jgi:hypothetical protein
MEFPRVRCPRSTRSIPMGCVSACWIDGVPMFSKEISDVWTVTKDLAPLVHAYIFIRARRLILTDEVA